MVPPQNQSSQEKYNEVRKTFCFYLDIHNSEMQQTLSKRIEDLGLVQEVFLTQRVTHVVRDRPQACGAGVRRWPTARDTARSRADAMLQRVHAHTPHTTTASADTTPPTYVVITVQKAILILDKIYDTFFSAPDKLRNLRFFRGHYIKIEFLHKLYRPVFKEFDVWPEICLEPELPKENKESSEHRSENDNIIVGKMTRKSRPRIREKEEKETKGGYCEMCNTDYADAVLHRRSPHHLAFVRDQTNFLALDSLIGAGADVSTFLDKTASLNGERRSLRIMCNGEPDPPYKTRSHRSQSPVDLNGASSPRRVNGGLESGRGPKRSAEVADDRQYYKVVGVSTKLRSSGGFSARRRDSPPPLCNGTEPLVVKFRKVRRSELSVLSDEAEQFMFPKRASSTSSTSSDEEKEAKPPPTPNPPPSLERRRLARPLAFKEESSEEDSWPDDRRKRKRRGPGVARRGRPLTGRSTRAARPSPSPSPLPPPPPPPTPSAPPEPVVPPAPPPQVESNATPVREEPSERCLKWENGKLCYTPAVEQLEFAFERVPLSEPWFETFKRQDEDKVITKNVPQYFALYSRSPKLPYEIGQLPPLKPNCCPLSDLVKREDRSGGSTVAGPSRGYGTRGIKRQRGRKRAVAALLALEAHPRKSPREHASTLAILGSAGLLHRRRHVDDAKSTASEDTISDTHSAAKLEHAAVSETRQASERLHQFFSEVFEDVAEYEVSEEAMDGETTITTSTNTPDVLNLVSESGECEIIRDEIRDGAPSRTPTRRGYKFKKKNRTGWPNKKKAIKKDEATSAGAEADLKTEDSLDRSSTECRDTMDESTQDESASETDEPTLSSSVLTALERSHEDSSRQTVTTADALKSGDETLKTEEKSIDSDDVFKNDKLHLGRSEAKSSDNLLLDVKVLLRKEEPPKSMETLKPELEPEDKGGSRSSISDSEDKDERERRRAPRGRRRGGGTGTVSGMDCKLLQPVVRVARVDGGQARTLRSARRARSHRHR